MPHFTRKALESRNVGQLRHVQLSDTANHKVKVPCLGKAVFALVLCRDGVRVGSIVPDNRFDSGPGKQVRAQVVFRGNRLGVEFQFGLAGVVVDPVRRGSKGEGIEGGFSKPVILCEKKRNEVKLARK